MADIEWEDAPEATPRADWLNLFRPKGERGFYCAVLCPRVCGLSTHWNDGTRIPCLKEKCSACHDGAPKRWYGYLAVCLLAGRQGAWTLGLKGLAELSAEAGAGLKQLFPPATDLTGKCLWIRRADNRPRSAVVVSQFALPKGLELPPGPDVQAAVRRLYKVWPGGK